jgi:hypothetical protein
LLTRDPSGTLCLIEVKSDSHLAHLSGRQKARLLRVANFLAQWEAVELFLAVADGVTVELIPVDALTAG